MSVLEQASVAPAEQQAAPRCQCDPWYVPCGNVASWFVTRHDCPARLFGRWRSELMLRAVGNDRIIHSGVKSGFMCAPCRDNLRIKFSFGRVHCWGCLRAFHTYDEYYTSEVKL